MSKMTIFPTTIKKDNVDNRTWQAIYLFNRWRKMLHDYGKLDPTTLNDDLLEIDLILKDADTRSETKQMIATCRDSVLAEGTPTKQIRRSLRNVLVRLCNEVEDETIRRVKAVHADQGMTERYKPLSKRLEREKIHRIGKEAMYTDTHTDSRSTTKLVRRFIEKRAAQAVHRNAGRHARDTNRYRQSVRRATSFMLYSVTFTDYDTEKRVNGTHWRVVYYARSNKPKRLKAKHSYNTYEDAAEACTRYMIHHVDDHRQMSPYKCSHCGKWHIGHTKFDNAHSEASYPHEQTRQIG